MPWLGEYRLSYELADSSLYFLEDPAAQTIVVGVCFPNAAPKPPKIVLTPFLPLALHGDELHIAPTTQPARKLLNPARIRLGWHTCMCRGARPLHVERWRYRRLRSVRSRNARRNAPPSGKSARSRSTCSRGQRSQSAPTSPASHAPIASARYHAPRQSVRC